MILFLKASHLPLSQDHTAQGGLVAQFSALRISQRQQQGLEFNSQVDGYNEVLQVQLNKLNHILHGNTSSGTSPLTP